MYHTYWLSFVIIKIVTFDSDYFFLMTNILLKLDMYINSHRNSHLSTNNKIRFDRI